jgi:hypothetical protein
VRIIGEITLCIAAFVLGVWFWTVARTPRHLALIYTGGAEFHFLLDSLGLDQLVAESGAIKPALGSYAANIGVFEQAHLIALARTRNTLAVLGALVFVCAALIGPVSVAIAAGLFLLPAFSPLAASAKNSNGGLVHSILLNLLKWNAEDPAGCERFCTQQRPDFEVMYKVVSTTRAQPSLSELGSPARFLTGDVDGVGAVTPLRDAEAAILGLVFENEHLYHGPMQYWLDRTWTLYVSAVSRAVYKVSLVAESRDRNDALKLSAVVLITLRAAFGREAEDNGALLLWNASDGNVVLQLGESLGKHTVAVFLTSSIARNFTRLQ